MMNLTHGRELDEETIGALVSGRADPAVRLLIDTVLALRGLEDLFAEASAGALLESEAEAELASDALAKAFAAIDALGPDARRAPVQKKRKTYPELIRLPPQLQALVREAEARKGWEYAGPGLRSLQLIKQKGQAKAEIIRIEPGAGTPVHTHYGREATLCLVGGFSDAMGSYGPGDVSLTDPSITHQPVADDDGVCFVLAVTDAGLKFKGVLGVLQKLLGQ
jgi:putative transcriptional regulator